MTPEQLQRLQHSLGTDQYGRIPRGHDDFYRNYFVGEDDVCDELVVLGLMEKFEGNTATGGDPCYRVTEEGILAMRKESPRETTNPAKERYRRYLSWADAFQGTFKDFLLWEKANKSSIK